MIVKKEDFLLYSQPLRNKRQDSPCRATEGSPEETEAGRKRWGGASSWFSWEAMDKARCGKLHRLRGE